MLLFLCGPPTSGWIGASVFTAICVVVVVYAVLLFRRWRQVEEYAARLHVAAPWLPPSPPFVLPAAHADDLLQLLRDEGARVIEVDTRRGQDFLRELHRATAAPSFHAPTREHLRRGHLLGELPRDRITAIVWRGAGCLASAAPQTYAELVADLTELRTARQPWQRIELFLVDDRPRDAVEQTAASGRAAPAAGVAG